MSTVLDKLAGHKSFEDIRDALKSVGCDVCAAQSLKDLEKVIQDQAVAGAQVLVNGSLEQGPGMRVTKIDKSGYRLSANGEAPITSPVSPNHQAGTPVQQVLYDIVNVMLPKVIKDATAAPSVVSIDIFKSMADGVDYYQNMAFGRDGNGRKNGLHPNSWYMRVYLHSQVEPIYVSLLPVLVDLKNEILDEVKHMINPLDSKKTDPKCPVCNGPCSCDAPNGKNIDKILG